MDHFTPWRPSAKAMVRPTFLLHDLYLSCLLCLPLLFGKPSFPLSSSLYTISFSNSIFTHLSEYYISLDLSDSSSMASQNPLTHFQDSLPVMAGKLGGDGLIDELCNGFNLLKDADKGVITFESLKRNSALLGLHGMSDEDLRSMLREGDFDGDGALSQLEFCVLMFRLSPELMEGSKLWLEEVLQQELKDYF